MNITKEIQAAIGDYRKEISASVDAENIRVKAKTTIKKTGADLIYAEFWLVEREEDLEREIKIYTLSANEHILHEDLTLVLKNGDEFTIRSVNENDFTAVVGKYLKPFLDGKEKKKAWYYSEIAARELKNQIKKEYSFLVLKIIEGKKLAEGTP